ncbi:uncharacterized protein LOC132746573 [Ruditapes philippinarum]|uniref:uncharacterized protein LOC132746573 n=1 Tax=Ruditapes philippinarum TaxID=129788 RepID=UPI00295B400C|nr:uncharacterized protein LOC132746573 [Ruditapes philippinarum]
MSGSEWGRLDLLKTGVSIKETQTLYQKWACSYNKDCELLGYSGPARVAQRVADLFPVDVRDNVNILDVGAGTGLVAVELKKLGFKNLDALEPSEPMLLEAKKDNLYNNYYQEFLTESPTTLSGDTYDVITGSGIYGEGAHVPCKALYEMIRLVKPGGYIILAARHEVVKI